MKKNKLEIICRFTLKYKPSAIFEFLYGKYQNKLVIYFATRYYFGSIFRYGHFIENSARIQIFKNYYFLFASKKELLWKSSLKT